MKVRTVAAALAAFMLRALAGAQDQVEKRPISQDKPPQSKPVTDQQDGRQLMLKFLEEHPQLRAALRKRADADGDGKLSPEERAQFMTLAKEAMKNPPVERRHDGADDRPAAADAIEKNRLEMVQLRQELKEELDQLRDLRREALEREMDQRQAQMQKRIEDLKQQQPDVTSGADARTGTTASTPPADPTPPADRNNDGKTGPVERELARPRTDLNNDGKTGPVERELTKPRADVNNDGKVGSTEHETAKQGDARRQDRREDTRPVGGTREQRQTKRDEARPIGGSREQRIGKGR